MLSAVSVYIAEASPASIRGPLVAMQSVFITMGRFIGALVSAVTFQLNPPTSHKIPVLTLISKANGGFKRHHLLQWLNVFDYSGRRSVYLCQFQCPSLCLPACLVCLPNCTHCAGIKRIHLKCITFSVLPSSGFD